MINCRSVPASVVVKMPCAEFPIAIESFTEIEGIENVAGSDLRAIPSGWSFCDTHHDTGVWMIAVGSSRYSKRLPGGFRQALLCCMPGMEGMIGIGTPPSIPTVLSPLDTSPVNPVTELVALCLLTRLLSRVRKTKM